MVRIWQDFYEDDMLPWVLSMQYTRYNLLKVVAWRQGLPKYDTTTLSLDKAY